MDWEKWKLITITDYMIISLCMALESLLAVALLGRIEDTGDVITMFVIGLIWPLVILIFAITLLWGILTVSKPFEGNEPIVFVLLVVYFLSAIFLVEYMKSNESSSQKIALVRKQNSTLKPPASRTQKHSQIQTPVQRQNNQSPARENPMEILNLRLAKGEISHKEYEITKKLLNQKESRVCSSCGTQNSSSSQFCIGCGTPI